MPTYSKQGNKTHWYLKQKKDDDLIVSGSPDYLIAEIAKRLKVNFIASKIDPISGNPIGDFCLARGKAKIFIDLNMPRIDNFYSDSFIDTPLALLADKAFLVTDKASKIKPWPHVVDIYKQTIKKINI